VKLSLLLMAANAMAADVEEDPRIWLEEVEGERALEWVRERNAASQAAIEADSRFAPMEKRLTEIFDSTDRIPYVGQRGEFWYNFWQDGEHPRGVWRRTTPESYKSGEPEWDVMLDLDALGAEEGENWVWKGASCLAPDYTRCLLNLSRGGADATVTREFDLNEREFVDGGFYLPEAKSELAWIDRDTVFVATDEGEGSLTDSGYPRVLKRWHRGTTLDQAETVYEAEAEHIGVGAYADTAPGYERQFVYVALTFFSNKQFVLEGTKLLPIEKPDSASASVWKDWILFELREDWDIGKESYKAGSLIAAPYKTWMKGKTKGVQVLFAPDEHTSLSGFSVTNEHLILNTLMDVKSRVQVLTPGKKSWASAEMPGLPENGAVSVSAVDSDHSDAVWVYSSDYITPSTLSIAESPLEAPTQLRQLPAQFDATGLKVTQHFATSKDGTKIPYFQVAKADAPMDGSNPTLLYGYGGFEVSLTPSYAASVGAAWLEQGGVYVVANIRGGGEYGPRWHQAALKENRMRAYEDFAAVGEDLVARGITSVPKLGIRGGSNGGLLMGNMLTLYPDHWGAVVCQVPLLDMKRYHLLLAGASWMGEYGDPDDPEQWAFMKEWSPYQNATPGNGAYPPILVMTSTRDDRVHPGHARKFAAKLMEGGEDGVYYYENMEGGHGGAANNAQRAHMYALAYSFLWEQLDPPAPVVDEEAAAEETE